MNQRDVTSLNSLYTMIPQYISSVTGTKTTDWLGELTDTTDTWDLWEHWKLKSVWDNFDALQSFTICCLLCKVNVCRNRLLKSVESLLKSNWSSGEGIYNLSSSFIFALHHLIYRQPRKKRKDWICFYQYFIMIFNFKISVH